ncbi:MAG TPA: YfhO family protein [Mycobacteriales bacterium]
MLDGPTTPDRVRRGLDRWTLLVAAVFVLWGIGLPLLGLKVFAGTDLLLVRPPWSAAEPTGFQPHLLCVSDTVDAVLPQAAEFHRRLFGGDFASWDPYGAGGSPLAAVPSSGLTSPLSLPYLLLPTWLAPAFVKLLELVVALGGMFLFLRRVGVGRAGAILAGLIYGSSGFLVVWTNWQHTRVAAFLPALFWACERLVQRRRLSDAALIAGVVACMLLGGFPAVTGYAVYAAAPYLLVRLWIEHRRPGAVVAGAVLGGVGLVAGAALVAVQLLPFVSQLATIDVESRQQEVGAHFPFFTLVTAFVPDAFGTCVGGRYYGPANPIEVIAFAGVTAAILAVVGLAAGVAAGSGSTIARGVRGYLAAALVTVLVLGWVGGPLLAAAQELPVFSNNFVGRIRVLLGFLLACLAGLGYDALVRGRPRRPVPPWRRLAAAGVWLLAGLLVAGVLLRTYQFLREHSGLRPFAESARLPVAVGVAALALVALGWFVRRDAVRRGVLLLLPALVLVESLAFVLPFWPRVDRSDFYPQTAAHRFLQASLDGDRFASEGIVLYPATGSVYGLRSVTGHSFTSPTWADLLGRIDRRTFLSRTFSAFPGANAPAIARSPILDRLSVRYFGFAPGALPIGKAATVGTAAGTVDLTDGRPVEVRVPAAALRGVGPVLAGPLIRPPDRFARLDVEVLRDDGTVLGSSSRRFGNGWSAAPFLVAVPAEDASTVDGTVRVRMTLHARGTRLPVAATAAGTPVLSEIIGRDDGLQLAFADAGAVLYERPDSLPRIRWASRALVETDPRAQVARLARGLPASAVMLDAAGPATAGQPATVDVLEDSGDTIRARVDAQGAGYLVVADALQTDWTVTVDGKPATLRNADHALVAVDVPAGAHEVAFAYAPSGRPLGTLVTGFAVLLVAGLLVADRLRRRGRHRRARPEPDSELGPPASPSHRREEPAAAVRDGPPD